ncbi:MAG: AbrB/MazE/SpoVT family DNA-binding domain-containing protein [Candidatus Solibacter sp.]
MRVELVRIGNSRGIRLPKPVIEQCGLGDAAELHVEQGRIVITPEHTPRQGWRAAFAAAGPPRNQPELLPVPPNEFDEQEWAW